jgi:hypothetical protein
MTETHRLYDEHRDENNAIAHIGDTYVAGCPTCHPFEDIYRDFGWDLDLAARRGWNSGAHFAALLAEDEDAISLTHPTNWLTEEEVESQPAKCLWCGRTAGHSLACARATAAEDRLREIAPLPGDAR